jgi:hypothetical protein
MGKGTQGIDRWTMFGMSGVSHSNKTSR